jgi:WD40 repeat protein/serine/threonine protein kinase
VNGPDPIERDRKARDIFLRAAEMPSAESREAYLAEACGADQVLRGRVLKLLESHRQDSFLEGPTVDLRPITENLGDRIGRYKLLQKIGEGGMGVVYMAEQEEPVRRKVALKIIKLGMDTKQVVARFEAERQALALMDHPNIARVLDGGATETGRPYFVMELVQGVPITEFCDQNHLSVEERLKLFVPVCQAIQSAHQKGIIHRDLKPTNILVALNPDASGFPKVIDFGVAKATSQKLTEKTLFTAHGMMVGTPAYMSPEQAEMSHLDVDTRADIYSLGALLYELLTGTAPFPEERLRSAGYNEMQRIILEEQPVKPSTRLSTLQGEQRSMIARNRGATELTLSRGFPGDLDCIVMKCLEKDRARRYETANGLARDLERQLNHEPVLARPPSRLYEFQRSVRRHWVGFTAVASVLVILTIGVLVSTLEAVRALRAEQRQRKVVYAAKIGQMQAAWEQNRVAQVRQLLEETADYPDRGFEWYYWQRQAHLQLKTLRGHLGRVASVEFSPDSKRVATGSQDRTVIVWDVATGSELLTLTGHLHEVDGVAFSSDGRRMLTASRDRTARVWDAQSGKQLLTLEGHTGRIQDAAFSPDDQRVLTASWDGTARIWDVATGKALVKLEGHPDPLHDAAFSPDGLRVVTGGDDKVGRVWDALIGKELFPLIGHGGGIQCVAFSPDGRRIVTGSGEPDPTAKVWDAATGACLFTLAGHAGSVNGIRFSSDSQQIVTCSDDQTALVWDAVTGKELFSLKGHTDAVGDVAISPDGSRIVTGSSDLTARLWDAASDRQVLTIRGHAGPVLAAAFSRDGRRIVTGSVDQTAAVWDAVTGERLFVLQAHHKDSVRSVAFSPDGRRILTGSGDQTAKVWDAANGNYLFTLAGHSGPVSRVAFSPDGRLIATGSADKTAGVWESESGKRLLSLAGHTERIVDLVFSPNNRLLATASADQTAKFWDTATGRELFELKDTDGIVAAVAFSPDATRIATTCSPAQRPVRAGAQKANSYQSSASRDSIRSTNSTARVRRARSFRRSIAPSHSRPRSLKHRARRPGPAQVLIP